MQTREFLREATNPTQWYYKSVSLLCAAESLLKCFDESCRERVAGRKFDFSKPEGTPEQPGRKEMFEALTVVEGTKCSIELLFGLSLETGMKGLILCESPEKFQINVVMNGSLQIIEATIKKRGVDGSGHELLELAKASGTVSKHEHQGTRLKEWLNYLSECILWRSRYPVANAAGEKPFQEYIKIGIGLDVQRMMDEVRPTIEQIHGRLKAYVKI